MTAVTITLTFDTPQAAKEFILRAVPEVYTEADAKAHLAPGRAITQAEVPPEKPKASPAKDPKPAAATTPAASQPSAGTAKTDAPAGDAVDYASLTTSVLKLMKLDAAAPGPIAKSLGFETFKLMKEAENAASLFGKAKALVDAKITEIEAAGV